MLGAVKPAVTVRRILGLANRLPRGLGKQEGIERVKERERAGYGNAAHGMTLEVMDMIMLLLLCYRVCDETLRNETEMSHLFMSEFDAVLSESVRLT